MPTPGALYWRLCRDLRRGPAATWHATFTLPRIAAWRNRWSALPPQPVPVHLLTGRDDWLLSAWMLASWFHATGRNWTVVIHDDGTLPSEAAPLFLRLFPDARLIGRGEADRLASDFLSPFPACAAYRRSHPLGLKIFDVPHQAGAGRYLLLDSDLLFFLPPVEILSWVDGTGDLCLFNRDIADGTLITAEQSGILGISLIGSINSGLCLIAENTIDYSLCERALLETPILQGHIWRVEQTLYALCASRRGAAFLPPSYEVSLGRNAAPDAVARHYVGAVRQRFYGEGLARVKGVLLERS